jgi:cystathionine beta-lyase/cystathionine gamma-synthase
MTADPRSIVRRQGLPESNSRPVVTPLYPSVVYHSIDADELDAQYEGRIQGYTYAREGHPNAAVLGEKIDWLEGVTAEMGKGVVTSSGMGAVATLFLGLLKAGDHIVAGDQLYGRSLRLLTQDLPRLGFQTTLADPTDADAFARAIRPETKMLLVEVVSNPTLRVADMEEIARMAGERGLMLAVDNTFTTPRAYRPFTQGADVVIHSITKLLAGHSDVTLGWIAANSPKRNLALYDAAVTWGLTSSPFDCWLAERGLHTFELRFDRAQASAAALAEALDGMEGVEKVLYPGRADHPDHQRAMALLGGKGANMVSFRLAGGRAEVNAFLRAAENIVFAPTLGDVGTTLSHPASSSHRGLTPEDRAALGITESFIRISVGCEDPDQLIREIAAAVAASRHARSG